MEQNIIVLGGGSWGTALANLLAKKGYSVTMWLRDSDLVKSINENKENKKYLPGVSLSENLKATYSLDIFDKGAKVVVSAIPTQGIRDVLKKIKGRIPEDSIIVNVSKGIETESLLRISEIVKAELGDIRYCVLSGPSHAEEVGRDMPTTVVVSSEEREAAEYVQDMFMTDRFRVYTNPDVTGVELGGSLKNIIALGAGISDGIGFGDNSKAALMSRGFVEMTKLGAALGASSSTFTGLSGIGDLIVTCTSIHSRNTRAGNLIGQGYSANEACEKVGMVVEGMKTTKAAYELAQKLGVDMPITFELYRVLFEGADVGEAMNNLMTRNKKHELEDMIDKNKISWNR